MQKIFNNISLSELNTLTDYLRNNFNKAIFLLYGELGSGKTSLVKEFCKAFDIHNVSSPTFNIMHIYENSKTILHIDFYRIKSKAEIMELNLYEYIENSDYTFIEWPNNDIFDIKEYKPISVYIDYNVNNFNIRNYRIVL